MNIQQEGISMKTKYNLLFALTCLTGVCTLGWLVWNYTALQIIQQRLPGAMQAGTRIFLGILVAALFHVLAAVMLVTIFRAHANASLTSLLALSFGMLSFIWLCLDWAALTDIGHEYFNGNACTTEWRALYGGLVVHLLFYIAMLLQLVEVVRVPRARKETPDDDSLFMTLHRVGVLCGVVGFSVTLMITFVTISAQTRHYIMLWITLYSLFLLIPYSGCLIWWRRQRTSARALYDEKQRQDLAHAGITAWIWSFPGLTLLFFLNCIRSPEAESLLWFPYYIFLTLAIFSGSALYYFKQT